MKKLVTITASVSMEIDVKPDDSISAMFSPGGSMEAAAKIALANSGIDVTDIQEVD